jgi:hypothetical protein
MNGAILLPRLMPSSRGQGQVSLKHSYLNSLNQSTLLVTFQPGLAAGIVLAVM